MTICTAHLPFVPEVPPMASRVKNTSTGQTRRMTPRVLAESCWVLGCVVCGALAQALTNSTLLP